MTASTSDELRAQVAQRRGEHRRRLWPDLEPPEPQTPDPDAEPEGDPPA